MSDQMTGENKPQIGLHEMITTLYSFGRDHFSPEAKELFFKIEKLCSDWVAIPLNVYGDILSSPYVSFLNNNGVKGTLLLFAIGNNSRNREGLIHVPQRNREGLILAPVLARTESFLYIGFTFSFDLTLIICFEDCPSIDLISDDFINDVLIQVTSHICNWRSYGSQPILCAILFKGAIFDDTDVETESKSEFGRERYRRRCREPKPPSPVVVNEVEVISITLSDEEDSFSQAGSGSSDRYTSPVTNVFSKEPTLEELSSTAVPRDTSMRGSGVDVDVEHISVSCRMVRFGSYKMVPQDRILISKSGLEIPLPGSQKKNPHIVRIMMKDIVKVLIHFGNSENSVAVPAIFYYVNIHAGSRIKCFLNKMAHSKEEIFFDPASKDELHKRITLLPEMIKNEERLFLKSIYERGCLLEEITWDEANEVLVRAAPKEVQHTLKKHKPTTSNNIKTFIIYPPPPSSGGITIHSEHYGCLEEGELIKDTIINFYLKYLHLNVLNEEEKKRTYIVDTFFYEWLKKCLKSSAADCHHAIKRRTKSVDIFEKDFIIIPINDRRVHWILGIICFPGLTGPVRMSDNTPTLPDNKQKDSCVLAGGQVPEKICGTTIGLVKPEQSRSVSACSNSSIVVENEDADIKDGKDDIRDEAEAEDEDMEPKTREEDLINEATPRSTKQNAIQEPIKQPCILIFDSLATESRSRECANLREFLAVAWKVRHEGQYRDFSKEVVKGAVPTVPQQTNATDCGVYVLQYFDSFFKNPITDYRMPIKSIEQWFTTDEVNHKRFEIKQLLLKLMREQDMDVESLNLSNLNLCASSMFDSDDNDEEFKETEMDDDALIDTDEDPIEEGEAEEQEENEAYNILDERLKAKHYNISAKQRTEAISKYGISPLIRLEPQRRIVENITLDSLRRFDTLLPRHERGESIRSWVEQARPVPVTTPRLPESVTTCEAKSKRKLPLSLKDIRNPGQSSSSTSSIQAIIEKVKRMKAE